MTNVASCLASFSKQEDGSSSCSTRKLSHVMQRPVVKGSRSGLGMKGDVSRHLHQVAHMLKIPNILIANEIPAWISRGTPGLNVSLRGRPPAGPVFCAALVSSVGRARTQHKELLICHWATLPNTSDAMLIEPLMKCQDLQRWRTGGQCPRKTLLLKFPQQMHISYYV